MKNLTINVGDYVRTKNGSIFKIIGGNEDNWDLDISFGYLETFEEEWLELYRYNDNYSFFNNKNILKTSPNIIDLIEVGDYVNGEKIIETSIDHCGRKILIYGYDNGDRQVAVTIYKEDIKSIVTREQMEAMEYKIER